MDSRERTFLALDFEEPDRIPIDFWTSKGFDRKIGITLRHEREQFLDSYDVDLRYIEGPRYLGPPLRIAADGKQTDIWGVPRILVTIGKNDHQESYREVSTSPLSEAKTVEEIQAYAHWPSPEWFDYSVIADQCEEIRKKGRVVVFMGDRLNRVAQLKPAMYLRGVEQIFVDMIENPNIADEIFQRIRQFYLQYSERILNAARGKLDILLTGDDFGAQNGPLISPILWERFLGEGFGQYVQLAHSYDVRVMHHSCGSVRDIIPMMLDRGLDVLQSLQPEALDMSPGDLKVEFGRWLSFQGGISVQKILPFGSVDNVREQVQSCANKLGRGGGYIFGTAHNIQADVAVENVKALFDAYHEFGRYNSKW